MNKNLQRSPFFSRSLSVFDKKLESESLINHLRVTYPKNPRLRVLEIGCGEGRMMLDLLKLFPNLEIHGINKDPWEVMTGRESLIQTALHYQIFKEDEINKIKLPFVFFYDAKELDYDSNHFDVCMSQVTLPYIKRKDLVLQEIWRTLKPGGKAFIQLDTSYENHVDIPDILRGDVPRFVIYKDGKLHSFRKHIYEIAQAGYDIRFYETSMDRQFLLMVKNTHKALDLRLEFDSASTINLSDLSSDLEHDMHFWGYRSVYRCNT